MADKRDMPKVDFEKENLQTAHFYSKFMEKKNLERVVTAKKQLRNKRIILASSVALALGIYSYTIIKIKQETFLDDFDEPVRVIKAQD